MLNNGKANYVSCIQWQGSLWFAGFKSHENSSVMESHLVEDNLEALMFQSMFVSRCPLQK